MTLYGTHYDSPIGRLLALATEDALTTLHMLGAKHEPRALDESAWEEGARLPLLRTLGKELDAYFKRKRTTFTIALAPEGTAFQQAAWKALCKVPYGETRTYGEQARLMRSPTAVRAVGAANGRNPIGIVIPCHRIIGASGALTGYAGGMDKKEFLLRLEGALPQRLFE
jgi:methylated-DNA-[protein]-cysteine S-methyltransferase